MITHALLIYALAVLAVGARAQTPEEAARQAVEQLTERLTVTPLEVEITSLVLENSTISSAFAERFIGLVEDHMKRNREDYVRVEHRSLGPEKLRRGFSLNQNYSQTDARVSDAILQGVYREAGVRVYVSLRLLGEDGVRIAEAEVPVAVSSIREEFKPPHEPEIREETEALGSMEGLMQDFRVEVEVNKGVGAVYYHGDDFEVLLKSEIDSFGKLVYRDVNGVTTTIYESPVPLVGGVVHRLPSRVNEDARWQIDCARGCGPETLVALASTEPFPLEPGPETRGWKLPEHIRRLQRRGVSPRALQAMSFLSVTTVERR